LARKLVTKIYGHVKNDGLEKDVILKELVKKVIPEIDEYKKMVQIIGRDFST